jgi:hypothetical protein
MYNEIMWQVPIAATPEPAKGEHRSCYGNNFITILLSILIVKWCPVLPPIFVNKLHTNNRYDY